MSEPEQKYFYYIQRGRSDKSRVLCTIQQAPVLEQHGEDGPWTVQMPVGPRHWYAATVTRKDIGGKFADWFETREAAERALAVTTLTRLDGDTTRLVAQLERMSEDIAIVKALLSGAEFADPKHRLYEPWLEKRKQSPNDPSRGLP